VNMVDSADVTEPQRNASPRFGREAAGLTFLVTYLVPAWGLLTTPGPTYEEGIVLFGAEQVADGLVAHRDFFSLYGPLSTWVPGKLMWLFGSAQRVERVAGFVLLGLLVLGVYALAKRCVARGSYLPVIALGVTGLAITAAQIIVPTAWWWGACCLVWGLGIAPFDRSVAEPVAASSDASSASDFGTGSKDGWSVGAALRSACVRRTFVTALLVGLAAGFRPELLVVGAISVLVGFGTGIRRCWRELSAGLTVGLLPLAVHALVVGPIDLFKWLYYVPVVQLRPYRRLPIPPSWGHFDVSVLESLNTDRRASWTPFLPSQQMFIWFAVLVLGPLACALVYWRGRDGVSRHLLAWCALSVGAIPQLVQRPDLAHLVLVSAVTLPFLVMACGWALRPGGAFMASVAQTPSELVRVLPIAGPALVAVLFFGLLSPDLTAVPWFQALHQDSAIPGAMLVRGKREVIVAAGQQPHLQAAVDAVSKRARPGERLIVGPARLSKMKQNDMILYHLFPDLVPGTYYVEVNPGVTNASDTTFADDLAKADWLILSHFSDGWIEPNDSEIETAPALDRYVDDHFCPVTISTEIVEVYERCDRGGKATPTGG
jgi:hypothetical protein